jgi:hypothetical protein
VGDRWILGGFQFVPMCRLLKRKAELGLAADHPCVVLLDCWSVHKTSEFRDFVKEAAPWIFILFVPAGCTSKGQPCDVGAQRPLKHGYNQAWMAYASQMVVEVRFNKFQPNA